MWHVGTYFMAGEVGRGLIVHIIVHIVFLKRDSPGIQNTTAP